MKALILAYDFPPYVSVGGLRPYSWFRYLREFGVEPVVITRQWANHYGDERDYIAPSATSDVEVEHNDMGTIVRTPYTPNQSNRLLLAAGPGRHRLTRKLITAWFEIGQYYATIGPKAQLYIAARRYLMDQKVDVIIATGEPFVLFRYASKLSADFGIPWVADYRDPWSQDRHRVWTRWLESRLERRISASAAAITTASEFFKHLLAQLLPGKPAIVVPNGYNPEAMATAQALDQGHEQLTIAFTGTISGWHPIESVFRVFDEFMGAHPQAALSLRMIGVSGRETIEDSIRTRFPNLARNVTFTGRLANEEMALELAKANAFLMFNMYAYSGTKVFDYLALRRKIILCYSDDPEARQLKLQHYKLDLPPGADEHVLERIVEETQSGVVVKDAAHLREVLTDLYREFEHSRSIACEPVGTEKHSRRAHAEQLAGILKGLVK